MSTIQLLPEHLINQIKAGEVIEKPAHLLKELLENAVDAGATKISIRLKNSGLDYLSIKDNGKGIHPDELPFAFARHATSKIQNFADLYRLKSYGFRGEALASIASIAKVTCESKVQNLPAKKYIIHGGMFVGQDSSTKSSVGTTMIIEELFFNTPVRLKFVKSKNSEKNAMNKIIHAFILSFPHIEFDVAWDNEDKKIFPLPVGGQKLKRLEKIFPKYYKQQEDKIVKINQDYDAHELSGYLSLQANKVTRGDYQFIFVNNRLIQDKSLHQAVVRGMEKIWGPARSSAYCLFLTIPESSVDVNIHPNKTVVKFEESAIVFSLIQSSIEAQTRNLEPFERAEQSFTPSSMPGFEHQVKDFWQAEYEIMQVSSRHFLLKKSFDEIYIFHVDRAIEQILSEKVDENSLMPLLINIPFTCPGEKKLSIVIDLLNQFQLKCSPAENHEILLFALHPDLSFFDYQEVTRQLIKGLDDFQFELMKSPLSSLENYIQQKGIPSLVNCHQLSTFSFSTLENQRPTAKQ